MDERIKKGNIEKDTGPKESSYYRNNIEKLIQPFVADKKNFSLVCDIATVMDWSDEDILNRLRSSDQSAFIFSKIIKDVGKALKAKIISTNAPWFKTLENKMLKFEIFTASMDLKKGEEDMKKMLQKMSEDFIRRKTGYDPNKGGPEKK